MDGQAKLSKRTFLKTALGAGGLGLAASALRGMASPRAAFAQLLESGIDEKSVLARLKKEGKLKVGYAQTLPWVYKDVKTNTLAGIYYDVAEQLGKELEIKVEYQEVSWNDSTVALRKGDFDLFGSSLFYTVPRALVVNYTAPLWHKGDLAICTKANAKRFKSAADFNRPDVTFSVNIGTREDYILRVLFPKAKIIQTSGEIVLAAEPVRTGKADLWVTGDLDALVFAKKNSSWATVVDPAHPFGRAANTWAIRYGDAAWKFFLDMWVDNMVASGFVQSRYDFYKEKLLA